MTAVTPAQIATLERIARAQNNLVIPLTNDERDQLHALVRTLRAQPVEPEPDEEGGS